MSGSLVEAETIGLSQKVNGPVSFTLKKGGKVVSSGRTTISSDGKTMTMDIKNVGADGKTTTAKAVYDKQ